MSDIQLGSISTSVLLDLSNLQQNANVAVSVFNSLDQSIKVSGGNITQNVKVMTDSIGAQSLRLQSSLSQISNNFGMMGGALGNAINGAVKEGADLEASLMSIAHNTSLTQSEIGEMTETVKTLGKESGASFTQLATGFAKITNMGFSAAQAPKILQVAMKAALATGTDVGQTAQILAQTMKTFGFSTNNAAGAMNVLVQASKDGNTTLQQFVSAAGPTLALAGSMNTSLTTVAGAFVTLTRAGFSASEAGTQIKNVLIHLAEPGQQVQKILADISKRSGIDLVKSFTLAAQSGDGMGKTLEKIRQVADKLGVNAADLEMKLIHAMRGGLGAMVLAKGGSADYNEEVKKLDATLSGNLDPTTAQFEEQQKSLNAQLAKGRNETQLLSMSIEKSLQPAIEKSLQVIHGLIEGFMHLSQQQQAGIVSAAALTAGFLIVVSTIARVIAVVNALSVAMAALGVASAGPVALGLLAAAAAAGLLYVAYNKLTESTAKSYDELIQENKEQQKAADAKANNAREALTLAERYDKLKESARLTKEQHQEMRDILNKISQLAPDMVSSYDSQGNALGLLTNSVDRFTRSLYEAARAQALVSSAGFGTQMEEKALQRDRLNDEVKRQRLLLQQNAVDTGPVRRVTGAEANNPLATDVHRNPFTGETTGYSSLRNASPAEQAATASKIRNLESQMAALERDRLGLQKQMKTTQAPYAPGHQGTDPAGDLHRKELAAKEAEIKRLKEEKEKLAHDAGLPNYQPPGKTKKGKEEKDPDMGDVIADHIKTATKSASVKASCAFFVSEVLKESGVAVKGSNSVKELWKQLLEGGAEEVSSGFKRGDILKFHGKNFGTSKDAEGKGNHTGIYNGDGTFTDSHDYNSRRPTRSLADYMKANPDADIKALRLGDKDDRSSKMVENHNDGLEKQAEKRRAAAAAELEADVWMQEVKQSDAASAKALNDAIHTDNIKHNQAELEAEEWMQEVKAHDRAAIKALDDAIFADRAKQNQAEIDDAVWIEEVRSRDNAAIKEQTQAESERLAALAKLGQIFDKIGEQQDAPMKHFVNNMKQNLEGILGGTFQELFDGKTHQLFDKMLQNFVHLLEQMSAKALAMGIINLLTGGVGGFFGGAANGNKGGGFLGAFGFDDATNDKKAQGWGFDFASNFSRGVSSHESIYNRSQGRQGGSGQSIGDVHVHMSGDNHFHNNMDVEHTAAQIARNVQVKLRMQPGTGPA